MISGKEEDEANNDVEGCQHFETGSKVRYACFKCDRYKPECGGARNCEFKRKADSSPVNNQNAINQKISELLAAKKKRGKKKEVEGSSSFIDSAIVSDNEELPSRDSVARDEKLHNGNLMMD